MVFPDLQAAVDQKILRQPSLNSSWDLGYFLYPCIMKKGDMRTLQKGPHSMFGSYELQSALGFRCRTCVAVPLVSRSSFPINQDFQLHSSSISTHHRLHVDVQYSRALKRLTYHFFGSK